MLFEVVNAARVVDFAIRADFVFESDTVLLAFRTHHFDGKPISASYKDVVQSNLMIVIAALEDKNIG